MKKRILNYLGFIDEYIGNIEEKDLVDIYKTMERHMTEIGFFMHERLIHLIVTVLFAIGTFMTVFTYLITENVGLLALAVLLIVLLAPYIKHYYLLENGVQKMYVQYDMINEEIDKRCKNGETVED